MLKHYLMLFRAPGFRDYTVARVKELAGADPAYRELPARMRAELEKEKANG